MKGPEMSKTQPSNQLKKYVNLSLCDSPAKREKKVLNLGGETSPKKAWNDSTAMPEEKKHVFRP